MKITFLGTGSSTPTPKKPGKPHRSYSGFLVEIGSDMLLFDIGPGSVTKMLNLGINILQKPSHIFISHYHLDHCLDYIPLAKARSLAHAYKQQINHLSVYGPEGLKKFSDDLFERTGKWEYMIKELKAYDVITLIETIQGVVTETADWKVTCIPIKHYGGVAYRINAEGKSIVYSGDMEYDEAIVTLGQDADIAILECSYPDRKTLRNKGAHLCPEDIGKLAALGNFKQTILTHMYPACEGRENEMIRVIENSSLTKVITAYDLMKFEL